MRVEFVPAPRKFEGHVWCGICAVAVTRKRFAEHDKTAKHEELFARYSRQLALDKVIPFEYDDRSYGLFAPDVARLAEKGY